MLFRLVIRFFSLFLVLLLYIYIYFSSIFHHILIISISLIDIIYILVYKITYIIKYITAYINKPIPICIHLPYINKHKHKTLYK